MGYWRSGEKNFPLAQDRKFCRLRPVEAAGEGEVSERFYALVQVELAFRQTSVVLPKRGPVDRFGIDGLFPSRG